MSEHDEKILDEILTVLARIDAKLDNYFAQSKREEEMRRMEQEVRRRIEERWPLDGDAVNDAVKD